ncbi:MAG: hypothetical protein HY775_05185 [Acidobacteria bacterium]|nr:hypothetical protein [Acidobacteriota bacterium]
MRAEPLRAVGGKELPPPRKRMGRRERALAILLAVIVALGGAYVGIGKLGSRQEAASGPAPAARPRAAASPSPSPRAAASSPARTFEFFEGRDPFEPLLKPPPPTPSPAPGDTAAPAPVAPADAGVQGRRVSLLDIFKKGAVLYALVAVDADEFTVKQGEVFATNFRVNVLTQKCGSFSYGDEGFTLCVGQEVIK